jgi:hypothetical protein
MLFIIIGYLQDPSYTLSCQSRLMDSKQRYYSLRSTNISYFGQDYTYQRVIKYVSLPFYPHVFNVLIGY